MIDLSSPLDTTVITSLTAGDQVELSGIIYTARDAAHQRLIALLDSGKPLPIDLHGQVIYYAGPTPPKPGAVIGSAGPTTSSRMDRYASRLIGEAGLSAMIGKGERGAVVIDAMVKYGAIYFAATGGAGALIARCITAAEIVCYEDLGPEAIYRLTVERMPLTVAIDARGNDLYKTGPQEYRKNIS